MNAQNPNSKFANELEKHLPKSNGTQRKAWAKVVLEKGINMESLLDLTKREYPISSRFLWFLSDWAEVDLEGFSAVLPTLLAMRKEMVHVDSRPSFARYWNVYALPEENEAQAIDLLFNWLTAPDTNLSTKRNAGHILVRLTKKYPELKEELRLCLESEQGKHTKTFDRFIRSSLKKLGSTTI